MKCYIKLTQGELSAGKNLDMDTRKKSWTFAIYLHLDHTIYTLRLKILHIYLIYHLNMLQRDPAFTKKAFFL